MGILARWMGLPELKQQAVADVGREVCGMLDKYHAEWAGFNREIESRVVKLEQLEELCRVLELRIQDLEHGRHALRTECESLYEQVARLMNRIRMRYAREDGNTDQPPELDPQQEMFLRLKGMR